MRKCQGSLDYLSVFGWMFIVVIIITVILFFLGVFNPDYDISTRTEMSFQTMQIGILDHRLDENGTWVLEVINKGSKLKNITMVSIGEYNFIINQIVSPYESVYLYGNSPNMTGVFGEVYEYNISIWYESTSTLSHRAFGEFVGYYEKNYTIVDYSIGEVMIVNDVNSSFRTISLSSSYTSPVIVCSYNLPNSSSNPGVVRINNVQSNSFEIMIQNPGDVGPVTDGDVHCIIMEEGNWLVNNTIIEAHTFVSNKTNENGDWTLYHQVGYEGSFTNPVVIGQVMSYNDTGWSVFWSCGSSRTNPPSSSNLNIGKTVCEDTDIVRNNEIIGYIILEQGTGTINNINYAAGLGADTVQGISNSPPYQYSFGAPYLVGIVSQSGMDGGNGGWAVLYGTNPLSSNQISLAIDEDMIMDSERNHITEQVSYLVFSQQGKIQ